MYIFIHNTIETYIYVLEFLLRYAWTQQTQTLACLTFSPIFGVLMPWHVGISSTAKRSILTWRQAQCPSSPRAWQELVHVAIRGGKGGGAKLYPLQDHLSVPWSKGLWDGCGFWGITTHGNNYSSYSWMVGYLSGIKNFLWVESQKKPKIIEAHQDIPYTMIYNNYPIN